MSERLFTLAEFIDAISESVEYLEVHVPPDMYCSADFNTTRIGIINPHMLIQRLTDLQE